jgi:hypothetical protein
MTEAIGVPWQQAARPFSLSLYNCSIDLTIKNHDMFYFCKKRNKEGGEGNLICPVLATPTS